MPMPEVTKPRRVILRGAGSGMYGLPNPLISSASANIGHCGADFRIGWTGLLTQQGGGRHNHSALAIATLGNLLRNPRCLNRMVANFRQPLYRRDRTTCNGGERIRTRTNRAFVDVYGASATERDAA